MIGKFTILAGSPKLAMSEQQLVAQVSLMQLLLILLVFSMKTTPTQLSRNRSSFSRDKSINYMRKVGFIQRFNSTR